ncbi:DUF4138 domain-containing protein [Capnocytophaga sp. oral taxon 878]|uniref:DUF4138 domain-containing protein n=1 Tax=Capnocytophaga sp. oral taxon 878 TaxID=1316596 RepID=UPI000D024AD0|nr:DUF4138 domain-containing protein [Capnocytophaga sp. oral taxon 878]AVM51553.1 hypothetical protein C4H12_13625 [Capnocytophaga sp. oral taxon 878]
MKKILFLTIALFAMAIQAQESKNEKTVTIDVNTDMFVQIVFKTPVQSLRVGMPNVVEAQYTENVITVQALAEELKTNLTVKTSDGLYYSFILKGTAEVPILFYEINPLQAVNAEVTTINTSKESNGKKQEYKTSKSVEEKVLDKSGYLSNRNIAEYRKIELGINGIYTNNGKLYFLMEVRNRSNIHYNVSKLSFVTASIKKAKKQIDAEEQEFEPLYFYPEFTEIKPKGKVKFVAVFNKFTLNNDKEMEITLTEQDGERVVRLLIDTETISNAENIK